MPLTDTKVKDIFRYHSNKLLRKCPEFRILVEKFEKYSKMIKLKAERFYAPYNMLGFEDYFLDPSDIVMVCGLPNKASNSSPNFPATANALVRTKNGAWMATEEGRNQIVTALGVSLFTDTMMLDHTDQTWGGFETFAAYVRKDFVAGYSDDGSASAVLPPSINGVLFVKGGDTQESLTFFTEESAAQIKSLIETPYQI